MIEVSLNQSAWEGIAKLERKIEGYESKNTFEDLKRIQRVEQKLMHCNC